VQALADETRTAVAFESPYRLIKALDVIAAVLPQRSCAVARELTKVHEELRAGTAEELADHYRKHPPRGEITILIEGAPRRRAEKAGAPSREEE
jgi:16S rRNA (cytidine1402-2'-O)-methyltransferase